VADVRATRARELHQLAGTVTSQAATLREQRDQLVRQLRREDRDVWTYDRLAREVGCSAELIARIVARPDPEVRTP
jgi:hypothetical protein